MKRALIVGMSVATAAALSLPALVFAQSFPPPVPSSYYGTISGGATAGQGVIAIVQSASGSQTCGDGQVLQYQGNMVYALDVIQDGQKAGCGLAGRTIRFYFTPVGANPGRLANETVNWSGPGAPKEQNLTLGPALSIRGTVPTISRDGTN